MSNKNEETPDWEWMNCHFNLRQSTKEKDILWNLSPTITLIHPLEEVHHLINLFFLKT